MKKIHNRFPDVKFRTISLPYLDGLSPTLESTSMKITEENGELSRAIGKFRGMSGEREGIKLTDKEAYNEVTKELLDVVQSAYTMILVLEKQYGIDVEKYQENHIDKLIDKGYIEYITKKAK
ncbi:MAG: nucleotide pyrophosphohydrolase [Firmicutes bacterium]|nr:nucleotide pyrophosphohydrolase [Bacillota bacterium]